MCDIEINDPSIIFCVEVGFFMFDVWARGGSRAELFA